MDCKAYLAGTQSGKRKTFLPLASPRTVPLQNSPSPIPPSSTKKIPTGHFVRSPKLYPTTPNEMSGGDFFCRRIARGSSGPWQESSGISRGNIWGKRPRGTFAGKIAQGWENCFGLAMFGPLNNTPRSGVP